MSVDTLDQNDHSVERRQVSEESRLKFNADGSARHFSGVTVVCHLPDSGSASTIHRAIVDNCFNTEENEALKHYYIQLPVPSLHMTLLDTLVYKNFEAGAEETSKVRAADLRRFRQAFSNSDCQSELRRNIPVTMEIDLSSSRYATRESVLTVPVKPLNEQEANKLLAIRSKLASAFNLPSVVDPAYFFHITVYYPLRRLSAERFATLQRNWSEAVSRVSEAVPTFEVDRIELCSFENMCHFEVEESI